MGYYINPKNGDTKEKWLSKNCWLVPKACLSYNEIRSMKLIPLVWVNNGAFTAVAIAYCKREYLEFLNPNDKRPKEVWGATAEVVFKECPELEEILEV